MKIKTNMKDTQANIPNGHQDIIQNGETCKLKSEIHQNGNHFDTAEDDLVLVGALNRKNSVSPTERRRQAMNGNTEEPVEVQFEDISAAAFRIKSGIRKTKCEVSFAKNFNSKDEKFEDFSLKGLVKHLGISSILKSALLQTPKTYILRLLQLRLFYLYKCFVGLISSLSDLTIFCANK